MTLNGNYYACLIRYETLLFFTRLSSGQYVQVLRYPIVSMSAYMGYIYSNGSVICLPAGSYMIYLFTCGVQNCIKCYWENLCEKCDGNLVVVGNVCRCPEGTFNVSGVCVSCTISNCNACIGAQICSSCNNGYNLVSNLCVCQTGKNISLITGKCVSCNITSCYRCDYEDICALFYF